MYYRFIALSASLLILNSVIALNNSLDDSVDNHQNTDEVFDIVTIENISYSTTTPIINVKAVSSIEKREGALRGVTSISSNEFNYMSPIKREFLSIDVSLIELIGDKNYNRYVSLQPTEYNVNIYSFINHFNIYKDFFSNLKLYSIEDVEVLYSDNSLEIAQLVMCDGAYYSIQNNTIYTVEWLYTASIDTILDENIPLSELELILDSTCEVISDIIDTNASDNYKEKIFSYQTVS